jgi:hypothetical protein
MRLSQVLKQFVLSWKPILANTMTSWLWTGIQLAIRYMALYVSIEIVLAGERHQLSIFSKAARMRADPRPSGEPSVHRQSAC